MTKATARRNQALLPRAISIVLGALLTVGTGVVAATPAAATAGLTATSTSTVRVPLSTTATLTGLSITGDTTDTLQATISTDLGTLALPTQTRLTLAYNNAWSGATSITVTGLQSDLDNALAAATLTTGGSTGIAHIGLTAMVSQPSYNYLSSNQHFYRYVASASIGWTAADTAAKALSFAGQPGYLATIPNATVNSYISNKIAGATSIWFGARAYESNATDGTAPLATDGGTTYARVWRWTAGANESPIAGGVVSHCGNKSPVCNFVNNGGLYSAWASGEPNNSGVGSTAYSGEWAPVTNWGGTLGAWNDLPPNNTGASGYVVEFGGNANSDSSLGTGFAGVVTDTSAVTVSNSASVPSAPSITATRGDGQVYLTWTPPADGGAAITGYDVWVNGVWNPISTTSADAVVNGNVVTTVTADVTGLTNGTTYSFMVRAKNSAGTGASSSMTPGTPSTVPGAPTGVSATAGNFKADLSWTAPSSDGGGGISGYTVTASPGGRTCATSSATSCTVTGLADGTHYTFTVHATNFVGNSPESVASSEAVPAAPVLTPSSPPTANQPQHATVVIPSGGSVTLLDSHGTPTTTVTVPGEGTYTLNTTTGVITFTPVLGFVGTPDEVAYRVTDSNGNTGTSTFAPGAVTAPVGPTASPLTPTGPVVTNQPQHATASIPAGGSATLLDGNGDPDSSVTVADQGTYSINTGTGVITFTPVLGYTGTPDPVGYRLIDAYLQSSDSTFAPAAVTAPAAPSAPALAPSSPANSNQPQQATVTIPTGGTVTLLDSDGNATTTVTVAGQGTYILDPATGIITFTPVIGYTGTPAPVDYQVTDAYGHSSGTGTFHPSAVTAPAAPTPPVLTPTGPVVSNQPQHATVTIPDGGSVTLLDGDGDPATTVVVPGKGTYTLDPDTGIITFTPVAGFTGTPDPVTYQVTDAYGQHGASTFTPAPVTAPAGPVASPLTPSAPADTNQPQSATATVPTAGTATLLDSHRTPMNTVTVAGQGTYTVNTSTGVITFTPAIGFIGTPTPVDYRVTDAYRQSSSSTFSPDAVTIPQAPAAPVLAPNTPADSNQPQHATVTIPDGGSVTLLDGNGDPATTVVVPGQGTYTLDPATGVITFTPVIGFTGTPDPVAYQVTDGYGQSTPSTFAPSTVTAPAAPVAPVLPPSAPANSNQPQQATVTIPTGGTVTLLDADGNPTTTVTVAGQGTYTLDPATGVITFTPVIGYIGTPGPVGYRVTDAYHQFTDSTFAPSDVTAPAAPTPPVLAPNTPADSNQPQHATVTIPDGGSVTLLDGDGDPATTVVVPGKGTYTLDPATGVITFAPDLGYIGEPGPVSYRVTDAYHQFTDSTFAPSPVSAPAGPVAPPVTPTAPTTSNQPQQTTITVPTGGTVRLVDSHGDPATTVTVPGEGTYVLDPTTGVVTFTPAPGFSGTPTPADYKITDAYGQSSTATFTPEVVTLVPASPTGITVTPGNGSTTVHFTAPTFDGGLAVTGYVVISSPGGVRTPVDAAGDATITGLSNGVPYTFTVVAINANGQSLGSTSVTSTPRTVPGAPTISGAVAGNGMVTLTVAAPGDNGGSAITGYAVITSPGGASTPVSADGKVTITGLTNGVTYTFTLVATNVAGDSAASASATATPAATAGAPSLTSLKIGSQWLKVTVLPSVDTGGVAVTGYSVTLSPGGRSLELTGPLGGTVRFTGLKNGVHYTVKAVTHNVAGLGGWSPALSGTPLTAPDAPKLRTSSTVTSLTLKLSPPKSNGGAKVRSYRVVISGPGLRTRTLTVPPKKKTLTVHGLRPHTRYKVVVTATNVAGRSKARRVVARTLTAPLGGVPGTQVAGHPIASGTIVSLGGDETFAFDSATLLPSAHKLLVTLAAGARSKRSVTCAGYADFGGDSAHEYTLAQQRASVVCDFLLSHGAASHGTVVSYGGSKPLVITAERTSRAKNRRVTITFS